MGFVAADTSKAYVTLRRVQVSVDNLLNHITGSDNAVFSCYFFGAFWLEMLEGRRPVRLDGHGVFMRFQIDQGTRRWTESLVNERCWRN